MSTEGVRIPYSPISLQNVVHHFLRKSPITIGIIFILCILYSVETILQFDYISYNTWNYYFTANDMRSPTPGILTAAFFHIDIPHLLVNISGFFIVGYLIESNISRPWFVTVIVLCGVGGAVFQSMDYAITANDGNAQGFSGAVRGLTVFTALHYIFRNPTIPFQMNLFSRYTIINSLTKTRTYTIGFVLLVIVGLSAASDAHSSYSIFLQSNVAASGHTGALLAGIILYIVYDQYTRK